jgi:preprotein translocase subunit YajC
MLTGLQLLAEQGAEPTAPPLAGIMPIVLIMGAFFLMMFFSSRNQKKQHAAMIASLKKNDKIVNSGGIIGVIESVKDKDDEVVLKGGLRVTKGSIVRVVAADVKDEK